jgi:regulator of protease activity HflC (stomatin/prohibitin superfamily)
MGSAIGVKPTAEKIGSRLIAVDAPICRQPMITERAGGVSACVAAAAVDTWIRKRGYRMDVLFGMVLGFVGWFLVRYLVAGVFTVNQNERAVKTSFGRAQRVGQATTLQDPIADFLKADEKERYCFPQVRVIPPGGPYFKWPWQRVYKVSIATQTVNMACDPETPAANQGGKVLEAVTKDQLNTGLTGQIRYRVSERNLYAFLFGIRQPIVHIMGYFTSVLRERIANFEAPAASPSPPGAIPTPETATAAIGVSINDLRKNLRDINDHMDRECKSSEARYGIALDASLITGIDPPPDVESALAAINTAYNQVSSDISLAQAAADQKLVQSRRAVEIETLKAEAEVEPLKALANQLRELRTSGREALQAYVRNIRLKLFSQARRVVLEVSHD